MPTPVSIDIYVKSFYDVVGRAHEVASSAHYDVVFVISVHEVVCSVQDVVSCI